MCELSHVKSNRFGGTHVELNTEHQMRGESYDGCMWISSVSLLCSKHQKSKEWLVHERVIDGDRSIKVDLVFQSVDQRSIKVIRESNLWEIPSVGVYVRQIRGKRW